MSYTPTLFPERKESIVGNIVRAVASINLETLEAAYHNVRYKVDYHMIHARLKYYSNSKNPRVIHTKLNNQRLITLRTNPHDPYFVKPGEFLTLGSSTDEYSAETLDHVLHYYYHPTSLDIESCPPTFGENEKEKSIQMVEGPSRTQGKPSECGVVESHRFGKEHRKNRSAKLNLDSEKRGTPVGILKKWDERGISSADTAGSSGTKKLKRISDKRSILQGSKVPTSGGILDLPLESLFPRYLQSSYSSPVTFADNEPHPHSPKKFENTKSATSGNFSGSLLEMDSSYGNYAQYSNLLQVMSPVESVSMFRQSSPRFSRAPGNHYDNKADDKKVWQVVLSDISLSAARLSTGSEGTSREDYDSLKGDLTHAKVRENPDYFAENLKQGKVKFHGNSPEEAHSGNS